MEKILEVVVALSAAERAKKYRDAKKGVVTENVTERDAETVTKSAPLVTKADLGIDTDDEGNDFWIESRKPVELDRFGVEIRPRICTKCPGLTFPDLISHSEHLATHNPHPSQWTKAYDKIKSFGSKK